MEKCGKGHIEIAHNALFFLSWCLYLRIHIFASFVSIHLDIMQFHINQHQIILITQIMMVYYKNNDALIIPTSREK